MNLNLNHYMNKMIMAGKEVDLYNHALIKGKRHSISKDNEYVFYQNEWHPCYTDQEGEFYIKPGNGDTIYFETTDDI